VKKFRNKYRIPSARSPFWDYSKEGSYYITMCMFQREMILSYVRKIVFEAWNKSFQIRHELYCDVFIIMPDHLHAILRINDDGDVETHLRASLQIPSQTQQHGIAYRPPHSISSFVACFKSSATKQINEFRHTPNKPVWQPRFHDHIIRDDFEYQRIRDYIINNPLKWQTD
jgi:putative transposase